MAASRTVEGRVMGEALGRPPFAQLANAAQAPGPEHISDARALSYRLFVMPQPLT